MHNPRSNVAILMATYNGESYVAAQIRSILDQTWPYWKLTIRDDGSQDGTPAIVSRFAEDFPDRISVLPSNGTPLGADGNFSCLMRHVESDYFMFCDQDDVWLPGKVEKSLECMRALEEIHGTRCPLLIHTDLRVVDADLRELAPSVWRYGYHNPAFSRQLNRLLVQNMVFGCSILINSRLKELAAPVPESVVQYDWWLALAAVCLGHTGYLPESTILYRQHGRNSVGAARWGLGYVVRKCLRFFDTERLVKSFAVSRRQAAILLDRYGDNLKSEQRRIISAYVALGGQGWLARRATVLRYGFLKTGLVRNIGLFLRI